MTVSNKEIVMGKNIFSKARLDSQSPEERARKARIKAGMDTTLFNYMLISARTQVSGVKGGGCPLFLEGPPGVAKTAKVKQFCDYFDLVPITLIMGNTPSVDIGGLWAPDFDKKTLEHFVSGIFTPEDKDLPEGKVGWLVFLDELSNAQELEQTALLTIIEEREHSGRKLPDNVVIMAAGNRREDQTGSQQLIQSLVDRFMFVDVVADHKEWLKWASLNGVHPWVQAWAKFKGAAAFPEFDPNLKGRGHPSPRSHFKASEALLNGADKLSTSSRSRMMQGILGDGFGAEINGFFEMGMKLPSVRDILDKPTTCRTPSGAGVMQQQYVIMVNIASYFQGLEDAWERENVGREVKSESPITKKEVEAALTYMKRFPDDMAIYGFTECNARSKEFSTKTSMWTEFKSSYQGMEL